MYDFQEYKNKMRDFYLSVKDLPGPIVKDEVSLLKEINKLGTEFVYDEKYEEFNNRFNPHRKACSLEVLNECIHINLN